ncbi:MAG: hypothetical protein E6I88_03470 [Chloroflexi bacterium]|nr:MAG: hypothetical protein E6I88_03470 [Chloroflexota bacterium]TME45014.1 MAG: hypothetical protein E6I56_10490 [Chloroflexota bacterium]
MLGLAVIAMRLPSLWEPRWYSDEGTFTTVAWLHTQGVALYTGAFDTSPPGIYWLYEVLLRAGADQHHAAVQIALLIAVVAAALCVYSLTRKWFGASVAIAAALLCAAGLSLPTLDGDLLNVEIAALPLFLGALVAALREDVRWAVVAGVLTAIALLIRPSYALDGLAVLFVLLSRRDALRTLTLAIAGGALALGAAALALAVDHSMAAYLGEVSLVQRAYLFAANGGSLVPLMVRAIILGGLATVWFVRARGPWRVLAVWLPASIVGASLTPRELSHYAMEAIPPMAITIAAVCASALRVKAIQTRSLRPAASLVAAPLALAALVGAAEAVLILPAQETALLRATSAPPPFLHNFAYADLPAYYGRWLSWVIRHSLTTQDLSGFPGPIREEADEAHILEQGRTNSRTTVLVLGDRAWVYFLGRLQPASRFVALNSAFRLDPRGRAEVAATLDNRRAGIVVLADAPPGDWRERLQQNGYRLVASSPWPTFAAPE